MASNGHVLVTAKVRNSTKLCKKLDGIKGGVHDLLGKGKLESFLVRRTKMRFAPRGANSQAQRDPDGTPWRKLSDSTKRKYNKNRSQVLVDSRTLLNAIQVVRSNMRSVSAISSSTGAGFSIGVPAGSPAAVRARMHQRGGKAGHSYIPRRRFLGISKDDIKAVDSLIRRTLLKTI